MLRRVLLGLVAFCCLALLPMDAEAKRRGGGIPVPLPGLRAEAIVKVLDLPQVPALSRNGQHVDLGYKFNSGSGGEWVGYIGSDTEYLQLKPESLSLMLALAGLKEPPPVPDRPRGFSEFLWIGIGLLVLFGVMMKRLNKATRWTGF